MAPVRTRWWFPRLLIAAEIAAATALACLGLTLINSYLHATHTDPGFALQETVAEPLPHVTDRASLFRRLQAWQPRAFFALADVAPLADPDGGSFEISAPRSGAYHLARKRVVSATYFATLRIPLLAGRWAQPKGGVAISANLARSLFGPRNPVGRQLRLNGGLPLTVIAVVGDVRDRGLSQAAPAMLYAPLPPSSAETGADRFTLLARFPVLAGHARLRSQLRERTGGAPVYRLASLASNSLVRARSYLALMSLLGLGALALSVASAFGLTWAHTASRERELGIRAALGASSVQLASLVLRRGLALGAYAIPAGVALGLVARMRLGFDVPGLRGPILGPSLASAGLLAFALLAAASLPARRASQIPPAELLRLD